MNSKKDWQLSAYLYRDLNNTIFAINKRACRLTGLPIDNGEPLIVLRYSSGDAINCHNDYSPSRKHPRSGRIAQILFYLNDVDGGETYFPNMGLNSP